VVRLEVGLGRRVGRLLTRVEERCKFVIEPLIGPAKIGSCLGLALWAEVAVQALSTYRAGPARSTINRVSDRARAVLFRAVAHAANRARPIWNTIVAWARIRGQVDLL
jgi:hypothetical protein